VRVRTAHARFSAIDEMRLSTQAFRGIQLGSNARFYRFLLHVCEFIHGSWSDIVRRPRDRWVIDFGTRSETESAKFEAPFAHVVKYVKPKRLANLDRSRREHWWMHGRTGDDLRAATAHLSGYLATPRVAKHRIFVRLPR
jgi:hypothetical protein